MSNSVCRVIIPTNPKELLELAEKIYQKHMDLEAASPLNAMVSHNWTNNGTKVAEGLNKHEQAESLSRQAEQAYRERDLRIAALRESVKASRDLLLGVYRETPKVLGQFGFEVNDTVRAARKK